MGPGSLESIGQGRKKQTSSQVAWAPRGFSRVRLFDTLESVDRQAPLSMGILQARILEWVAMPSSRGSFQPRERTQVSCIAGGGLYHLRHQGPNPWRGLKTKWFELK